MQSFPRGAFLPDVARGLHAGARSEPSGHQPQADATLLVRARSGPLRAPSLSHRGTRRTRRDYTKDALVYGNEWSKSHIWDDDWFGATTPRSTDHRLTGRFAGTPVPTNMSRPVHNSYGRITSTINNDPTKYTSRANEFCGLPVDMPLPGCKEMIGCLDTKNLVDLHACAESELHGDLHAVFGGVWDCPYSIKEVVDRFPWLDKLLGNIGCKAKSLYTTMWNERLLLCPDTCSDDTPFSECSCACPLVRKGNLTFDQKYNLITGGNNAEPGNDLILKVKRTRGRGRGPRRP